MTSVTRVTTPSTGARVKVTILAVWIETWSRTVVSITTRTGTTYNITNTKLDLKNSFKEYRRKVENKI